MFNGNGCRVNINGMKERTLSVLSTPGFVSNADYEHIIKVMEARIIKEQEEFGLEPMSSEQIQLLARNRAYSKVNNLKYYQVAAKAKELANKGRRVAPIEIPNKGWTLCSM